jgi:YhcH/YjgK/YiaL family protein
MIVDSWSEAARYEALHPRFARAFEFFLRAGLATMAPGRYDIDGSRLYLSVDVAEGRGREGARLESHRRYIDIQYVVDGDEEIGWQPVAGCRAPGRYDEARDIVFYDDRPASWISLPPGHFAIFFPGDAHAPLGGRGAIRKAIVKVAVE